MEQDVRIYQSGSGVAHAEHQHIAHEARLAFLHPVEQFHFVALRRAGQPPIEGNVRVARGLIQAEDDVAIQGDAGFAEGLPGRGGQARNDLIAVLPGDAGDIHFGDAILLAFIDLKGNRDIAGFALIIVYRVGGHLGIAVAVILIQSLNGGHIAAQEAIAVAAVAQTHEALLLEEHALADCGGSEVAVARYCHLDQAVPLAETDDVRDLLVVRIDLFGLKIDLHLKVPAVLKVVGEVGHAAHQEIPIDSLFIEDRDILLQIAFGDFGAFGLDLDLGAAIGVDGGLNTVGGRIVFGLLQGNGSGEAFLLVVLAANVLKAALLIFGGGQLPAEPPFVFGGFRDGFPGKSGIAGDVRKIQTGALAALHFEGQGHLLMFAVALDFGLHGPLVQAVALHQALYAFGGGVDVFIVERHSQIQPRRVGELACVGREADFAANLHGADEPLVDRAEDQCDAVRGWFPFDLDILIGASPVEALDGVADAGLCEGRAGGEGNEPLQVCFGDRLQLGIEADLLDRLSFIVFGYGEIAGYGAKNSEQAGSDQTAHEPTPQEHIVSPSVASDVPWYGAIHPYSHLSPRLQKFTQRAANGLRARAALIRGAAVFRKHILSDPIRTWDASHLPRL